MNCTFTCHHIEIIENAQNISKPLKRPFGILADRARRTQLYSSANPTLQLGGPNFSIPHILGATEL